MCGLRRHFCEPSLFRREFFGGVFNTPQRVHLYIRNTEAAIKQRYPVHYLVIAGLRSPALLWGRPRKIKCSEMTPVASNFIHCCSLFSRVTAVTLSRGHGYCRGHDYTDKARWSIADTFQVMSFNTVVSYSASVVVEVNCETIKWY